MTLSKGRIHVKRDEIFTTLIEAIQEGQFQPGESLTERELAERLGVSRTPVREAFRRLEKEGLVVYQPHKGVTVAPVDVAQIRHLYRFREVIEGLAARLMAENRSKKDLAALGEVLAEAELAAELPDLPRLSATNRRFHILMAKGSGNMFLERTLVNLMAHVAMVMSTSLARQDRPPENIREHQAIVTAISQGDAELAEAVARAHVRNALAAAVAQLTSGGETSLKD